MPICPLQLQSGQSGQQEIRLEAVPACCRIGTLQIRSHILFGDKVSVIRHETSKEGKSYTEVKLIIREPIISKWSA